MQPEQPKLQNLRSIDHVANLAPSGGFTFKQSHLSQNVCEQVGGIRLAARDERLDLWPSVLWI